MHDWWVRKGATGLPPGQLGVFDGHLLPPDGDHPLDLLRAVGGAREGDDVVDLKPPSRSEVVTITTSPVQTVGAMLPEETRMGRTR